MPVETAHPLYGLAAQLWRKCRDAAAGQEAVHAGGVGYLPRLSGQDDLQYSAYVLRTLYYNATGRTIQALRGMVFRREPAIDLAPAADYLKADADGAGTPLVAFAEDMVEELLTVGRVGVLVDYPRAAEARTRDDERAIGARPFLAAYRAEQIINWRHEVQDNRRRLSLVVLKETYTFDRDDYSHEQREQWRVLRLVDGFYRVQVWRTDGAGVQVLVEDVQPTVQGRPMPFIPFILCGPRGPSESCDKPPILDLVNVNLAHYRDTADYQHGLHYTGLPTAVITGHDAQNQVFAIGSATAWVFPSPDVKAFFLEFQGAGLGQLREAIDRKEAMMAALGARMLAPEKRGVEASDTVAMRHGGEHGALASVANAASGMLTKVLTWALQWAGINEAPGFDLNTDYMPAGLSAQELTALVAAVQAGTISHETLYYNLRRGDIAEPGIDFDEERARIAAVPLAPSAPDPGAPNTVSVDPPSARVDARPQ